MLKVANVKIIYRPVDGCADLTIKSEHGTKFEFRLTPALTLMMKGELDLVAKKTSITEES